MASRRRFTWAALVTPVVVISLLIAGWAVDTSVSSGEVPRNTELAGRGIGGLTESDLGISVAAVADEYAATEITIASGEETYRTTAGQLGLAIDEPATIDAALLIAEARALPARPFAWVGAIVSPNEVEPVFHVDSASLNAEMSRLEGDRRTAPVEPSVSFFLDSIVAVPGEPGQGIDVDAFADDLLRAADRAGLASFEVSVEPGPIAPKIADADAEALAAEALALTEDPITVAVGVDEVQIEPETQRSWITSDITEAGLTTTFDVELIQQSLKNQLSATAESPIDATFTIEGGVPVLVPGRSGTGCCAPDSGEKVLDALQSGVDRVELALIEREPDLTNEEAEALGIVAEVGSPGEFGPTTRHACCQNRVTNIHRISDIVRGAIILPGETFSVNDYVGKRTIEKGFVADGVIYDGVLTEDVGGGVSQFATTLFNAALFAGLDFGEYQSHSLYISRYPKGHEATISFPAPDLEIVNNTPFGVMIWPEYTDTSLTVRLYSTPFVQVGIGEPTSSPSGNCTRFTTPRTRTYPDGSTDNDTVSARYRPGEGISC
ncbi:MAG TPA: VanW family protein [Acidimicrobiales bacterium]|nr:VanW family protein [Acidimicrobiales bacterium]